jgi:glycosyltransferase involved in cell wall biosynthesis
MRLGLKPASPPAWLYRTILATSDLRSPMKPQPLFTIITSTLNSAPCLERCLQSVHSQSLTNYEHLIADGASTDSTLDIIQSFSSLYSLHLVCSAPDSGLYQAWNRAIDQSRGQWILFLGSDDFLLSATVLESLSTIIASTPGIQDILFIYGDTANAEEPDWGAHQFTLPFQRLRGITQFPTSVFINSKLFHRGYRFDESYRICADHKFFAQHDLFGNSLYVPMPIMHFQKGGISSSSNYERMHYAERRRMLRELNLSRPVFTELYYWLRSLL